MKTKLKKILSIALPLVGLTTSIVVAAPFIVSSSDGDNENKPQTSSNLDNGGSKPIQIIKLTPKNKYANREEAYKKVGLNYATSPNLIDVFESNGWAIAEILGYHNEAIELIFQYIIIKNVETQIVIRWIKLLLKPPQEITNPLTINKTWSEFL